MNATPRSSRALAPVLAILAVLGSMTSLPASAEEPNAPPAPLADPAAAPTTTPPTPTTDPATPDVNPAATPTTPITPTMPTTPSKRVIVIDALAEEKYEHCKDLFSAGEVDDAHKCLLQVSTASPGTEAALKADAALFILDAHLKPVTPEGIIPAGRLGITAALGLFGAENAIAGGLALGVSTGNTIPPQLLVLGTGLGAVVLGIGGGFAGYYLAENLKLNEGAARLVASSLVWGNVIGAGLAPAFGQLVAGPTGANAALATDTAIFTVVGFGYALGGAALLLTSSVGFDEAQVGLINSGGLIGAELGVIVMADMSTLQVQGTLPYSATFVAFTGAGLAAGAVLGRTFDTTWGEVLICDLGGVLGLVAGGAVGAAIATSRGGADISSTIVFATGATGAGTVAGYGIALGIVTQWRASRGAPIFRGGPELRPAPMAMLDGHGRPVAGLGIVGEL